MQFFQTYTNVLSRFSKDEQGSMTVLGIYFLLICMIMGGLSIDFNHRMGQRTSLQVTGDSVAHAALYKRERESAADAKDFAVVVGKTMLPVHLDGNAILTSDIEFGTWDVETREFVADEFSLDAVRVITERNKARNNEVSTFLLSLVGMSSFNERRESIFATYNPACFREGFVAEGVVDLRSNNNYFSGYCIHSNSYVSLNQNNFFEPGTVVSMPDTSMIDLPNSGFESNDGLEAALRNGRWRLRIINRLPEMINDLYNGGSEWVPDYVTGVGFVEPTKTKLTVDDFESGRKHKITCNGGKAASFDAGVYSNLLIVTNCKIQFKAGVELNNVILASTNGDAKSIVASSGLRLGRDDNCGAGGGAIIMTMGGFDVPADLQMYGSQVLAMKTIGFAANADGIQGASMISGETISGTSNMNMGFCNGGGMEDILQAKYFRMVR